jgi:hypothetical protein
MGLAWHGITAQHIMSDIKGPISAMNDIHNLMLP